VKQIFETQTIHSKNYHSFNNISSVMLQLELKELNKKLMENNMLLYFSYLLIRVMPFYSIDGKTLESSKISSNETVT
jgi:hypothetical protein